MGSDASESFGRQQLSHGAESACTPSSIREQLKRILASSGFRNSEALRHLLHYTVEAALSGNADQLKEYSIAVEALGRPPSFDPHQDTNPMGSRKTDVEGCFAEAASLGPE